MAKRRPAKRAGTNPPAETNQQPAEQPPEEKAPADPPAAPLQATAEDSIEDSITQRAGAFRAEQARRKEIYQITADCPLSMTNHLLINRCPVWLAKIAAAAWQRDKHWRHGGCSWGDEPQQQSGEQPPPPEN